MSLVWWKNRTRKNPKVGPGDRVFGKLILLCGYGITAGHSEQSVQIYWCPSGGCLRAGNALQLDRWNLSSEGDWGRKLHCSSCWGSSRRPSAECKMISSAWDASQAKVVRVTRYSVRQTVHYFTTCQTHFFFRRFLKRSGSVSTESTSDCFIMWWVV